MNILYLCDEYPPGQHGGIGTSVALLARAVAKLGHSVVVAGLYSPGYGGQDEFIDQGVKVYRFRWANDHTWLGNRQSLLFRLVNRVLRDTGLLEKDIKKSLATYQQQLEKLIAQHQIDIIEIPDYNDYMRFTKSDMPLLKFSVPYVVKMNGSVTYFTRESEAIIADHLFKMEQRLINSAAAVAAVSQYTAAKSAAYFGYDKHIEVIPNGIDTNILVNVTKNAKQVIFTGSLIAKKGIYQLVKAWNIVVGKIPDAQLIILGKGSQKKVASLLDKTIKQTVQFMGHVPSQKLYEHLAQSAVAVFPSYSEAFALAPLEAMACGTAVINSTRTSGPELIEDGIDGLLIDPNDVEQIATAIIELINDPVRCEELAKSGNQKVKAKFDINQIATKNIVFYNTVLKHH